MATLEKGKSPRNSPLSSRRRNRMNVYPNSLPGSRSSSPGRNVMTKKAIFEHPNNTTTSTSLEKKEGYGHHSAYQYDSQEIKIEGVEEFEEIYNSTIKKNTQNLPSFVTKPSAHSYGENRALAYETSPHNARKTSAAPGNIDRSNAPIIPDYVSAKANLYDRREAFANENAERRRFTKRARAEGRNARRYQTLQDRSLVTQVAQQAKKYQPNYIQLVPTSQSPKGHGDSETDVYSQEKRDTALNSRSFISAPNEQKIRNQVKAFEKWQHRTRLPSSGDSSNNEMTTSLENRKKTSNYIDSKPIGTFKTDPEKQMNKTGRRQQRLRNHNDSIMQGCEKQSSSSNQQSFQHSNSHKLESGNEFISSIAQHPVTAQDVSVTTNRRTRMRRRPPLVPEVEEKYSTIPANFRPGEATNSLINREQQSEPRNDRLQASDSICNHARSGGRNELMITDEQTLVSSEDTKKKSSDVKEDIANHSVHTQSLQSNHSSDKPRYATGFRGATEKTAPTPNRSKQIDDLRKIFNGDQLNKIEYGTAYNNKGQKTIGREIGRRIEEIVKPENEFVAHSQPQLKVIKIGEDFWPKDAATEKLLKRNSTNSNEMLKNVTSDSKKSTEVAGNLPSQSVTDEMLRSPKETNLNDPIDFSVEHASPNSYPGTGFPPKAPKTVTDSCTQTVSSRTADSVTSQANEIKRDYTDIDAKLDAFDSNYNSSGGDLSKVSTGYDANDSSIYKDAIIYEAHIQPDALLPASPSERKNSTVSLSTPLPRTILDTKNSVESLDEGIDDRGSSNFGSIPSFPTTISAREIIENLVPSASNRRRRKGSAAAGQHGSDTSNNSGESNRSLSDPTADRKKSPNSAEEEGPVDSNMQYPLKTKEYKESRKNDDAKSDVSERSDTGSILSDTIDKMDEEVNHLCINEEALLPKGVKNNKKKSFSDPDSKAVAASMLNKNDIEATSLQGSSSDPNLAEAMDSRGSLSRVHSASRSSHETSLASERLSKESSISDIADITRSIGQLSESLASDQDLNKPTSKKFHPQQKVPSETSRLTGENDSFFKPISESETDLQAPANNQRSPSVDLAKEEEQFNEMLNSMVSTPTYSNSPEVKPTVAHGRSVSEPATDYLNNARLSRSSAADKGRRRPGIVQAPSLSDVLHGDTHSPKPTSSLERIPSATLPRSNHGLDYNSFHNNRPALELRRHVMGNLKDSEGSYVNCLRNVCECYLEPLKRIENHHLCEPRLVDEIFYKIPELWQHHQRFYDNVQNCYINWDPSYKIGDLFLESFNEDTLLDTYTSYIGNFRKSKKAIATACDAKANFKMFLEQCQRENKDKQSLSDLMIQPVQRIPRYELLIKDLLKHTPEDHPDRESLLRAKKEIHALAVQINQGEKIANRSSRILLEIEQVIEGFTDISGNPKRKFLHQHTCMDVKSANKKDRSLWLFNDLLICTTMKKVKSQTLRKSSMNLSAISQDHPPYDVYGKYKFIWKYPLEDVSLKGCLDPYQREENEKQIQILQRDLDLFEDIQEMAERLNCEHMELDDLIDRFQETINQRLLEKQKPLYQNITLPGRIEMLVSTQSEGTKSYQFDFISDNSKTEFERYFWDAKRSLNSTSGSSEPVKNSRDPTFLKSIAIIKTRNGMQFSCAASNINASPGAKEVWVCNTDGYVGQICFLTLDPEPNQTQCITVCSSKICCIAQVPAWDRKLVPINSILNDISKETLDAGSRRRSSSNNNLVKTIMSFDEDSDETDEDNTSPISTINTTSPYSTLNNVSPYGTLNSTGTASTVQFADRRRRHSSSFDLASDSDDEIVLPVMTPLMSNSFRKRFHFATKCHTHSYPCLPLPPQEDMMEGGGDLNEPSMISHLTQKPYMPPLFGGGGAYKKDSDGVTRYGSLGDLLCDEQGEQTRDVISGSNALGSQGSMWLGTEDGKINIYSTSEAVRASKDSIQLHHTSAVQCILNYQDQVFVALSNGDLICYARDHTKDSQWDFTNKKCLPGFSSNNPISKMLVVNQRELWCGCQNQIRILDIKTHNLKSFFSVSSDNKRQIYCMASCGYGVWVALDKKPQARLYHSITHEQIVEVDISHSVTKMLANSDPIIRQHKAACLRITSLLVCKDLLWVGTSAGVVLTLTLPNITESTTPPPLPTWIQPQGLPFGHTGHVRFLTAVEIPDKETSTGRGGRRASTKRRSSSASTSSQTKTKSTMLVISGGDGYENFQSSTAEVAGKDDSTNHLLIWKIP